MWRWVEVLRRARLGRWLAIASAIALLAIVFVASAAAARPPNDKPKAQEGAHPSCHGLANAYAHGGAVAEVAAKHGCDLTGITPVQHPANGDEDEDEDEAEDPEHPDGGEGNGPPADVVAAKCDQIAAKLAEAEARPHGNSAAAFARQADKWGCPD